MNLFNNVWDANSKLVYLLQSTDNNFDELTFQMPSGHYTMQELIVVFNNTNTHLELGITNTSPIRCTLKNKTEGLILIDHKKSNALFELLGGGSNDYTLPIPAGDTVVLASTPDLSGPHSLHVISDHIATGNCITPSQLNNGYQNLVEQIPVNSKYGYAIVFHSNDLVSSDIDYSSPRSLRQISIRLENGNGDVCSLPEGVNIDLTIKVFFRQTI
jgi:hypothetical protein